MINTNNCLVFGVAPYLFFAGIGLTVAFCFYIINIALLGKSVHKNAIILFLSFIGSSIGAVGFGYLSKICTAIYTNSRISDVFTTKVGIVFYGGLTGLIGSFIFYQKIFNKIVDKKIINIFATAIPLFHAFARIGCFFAGCCYGKEIDTIISVDYVHRGSNMVSAVFPVQLVEAALNLMLFFVLWYIMKALPEKNILGIYLLTYATYRFFLEFLRGDTIRGVYGPFSFSQIYSLLLVIITLIFKFTGDMKRC